LGLWGDTLHSTIAYVQTDAYFAGFTVGEVNAGLFKGFLYLVHSSSESIGTIAATRCPSRSPLQ
jgi:hypothetical protein